MPDNDDAPPENEDHHNASATQPAPDPVAYFAPSDQYRRPSDYVAYLTRRFEDGKPNPVTEIVKDYEQLEGFWRRYNKVKLDRLALEAEKVSLEEENMTLRSVLKQYLDGVSVNSETLKEPNPLFVVNQRTNVKFEVPQVDPRVKKPVVTVVEAAHAVKHTHH